MLTKQCAACEENFIVKSNRGQPKYCQACKDANIQWCHTCNAFMKRYASGSCPVCKAKQKVTCKAQWNKWFREEYPYYCSRCGYYEHTSALDWHHLWDKKFNIASKISGIPITEKNKAILKAELNKCICLCANCHRVEHN